MDMVFFRKAVFYVCLAVYVVGCPLIICYTLR